ncbi:MAG: DUF4350 domain-containing protein [Pseudomonas sp.]|uniref:DUF4350 domain-containing protein n=1 Tax=Pseudomonas sp. TaxID=306 RepID=UPI003398F087
MSRPGSWALGAGLALLLGLLGTYLMHTAVPYETTLEHGPSPEVAANPYLAAEHFLRGQGRVVKRADNFAALSKLPSKGQTLMLLGDRHRLTPRQAERLLLWAEKGGHLLFVAAHQWDDETGKSGDPLLDSLGIRRQLSSELDESQGNEEAASAEIADEAEETAAGSDTAPLDNARPAGKGKSTQAPAKGHADTSEAGEDEEDAYPELTKIYLENEQAPAYFNFDTDYHLYDAQNRAHTWANSSGATHLLQLYHGEGLITVLSDDGIWQNDEVASYDNAWLLWYLSQDSEVTLLSRADHDSLGTLLLRNFLPALVACGLLIALLLWHVGQRHGPLQAPTSRSRRQLEEHLRGSADFLLRHGGQHNLLQALQQDIQRRARRRHPGFERLAVAEQWQVLSRLTRQPTGAIGQAMRPTTAKRLSAAHFTRQVAHLQSLRNAL